VGKTGGLAFDPFDVASRNGQIDIWPILAHLHGWNTVERTFEEHTIIRKPKRTESMPNDDRKGGATRKTVLIQNLY
jgi:hypothetical protein